MLEKLAVCVLLCGLPIAGFAQPSGILKGQVADESGAVIPGAKVTAAGPDGIVKTATTVADGTYTLTGLAPGDWSVSAASPGLVQHAPAKVTIHAGAQTLNIALQVAAEKQEVTVQEQNNDQVSVEASNNAGALVLKGEELDSLSDDPDDLAQDLQALAGPAAGPNGGQIYIDGFTGGQLPPKESIREIRINQNPFSSEYDRLGFGRIEILTKPGSDKFRGSAMFDISDGQFNARNPFLTGAPGQPLIMPDFQTREYGGNVSGPLGKKASFFLDVDRREIDDAAVINARIVNPATFAQEPYSIASPTPQRRTNFSPRVDYALSPNNTLMARYRYVNSDLSAAGVGNFNLPDRAYPRTLSSQTGQLTETSVINSKWINETRLQIENESVNMNGNLLPVVSVSGAFTSGGSGTGASWNSQRHYEIQNYTSTVKGTHSIKFGVRVRTIEVSDYSQSNYGGMWTFSGETDPTTGLPLTSLDVYQRSLQGLSGYGPSFFSISTGVPLASVSQTDIGFFYQDDWRLKPNFTLSLGGRYETQTNIHDWSDFAPRVGFAWAPGGGSTGGSLFSRPKFVIRGGFGIFYDRIGESLTLQQIRLEQGQFSLRTSNPALLAYYPNLPPTDLLTQQQNIKYQIDRNIHAPYVAQSAIGVERQVGKNTSVAVTFTNTRGMHQLITRDINAPIPGSFVPGQPGTGLRPYGDIGDIYNYESTGVLNQNMLMVNMNTRITNKISMFGGYFYNHALSNVPAGLPSNDYNLAGEYGRSNFDIRNRGVIAGSLDTRWGIRLNPFIIMNSGGPFNIVSPTIAGNSTYALRPALAAAGASGSDILDTPWGVFDLNPYLPSGALKPGETIIPRNFGQSPGSITINLRISRTWGFGPERGGSGGGMGGGHFGGGGPHGGGPRGGGGMRMGGGPGGFFGGGGASTRRYQLTLSANARNLLNHTNYGPIQGMLGSPTFGESTTLAGGYAAESSPLNNRRMDFQLRFSF